MNANWKRFAGILALIVLAGTVRAGDSPHGVGIWNGSASSTRLTALGTMEGLTAVSSSSGPVKGDSILTSERYIAVFRQKGAGVEFYSVNKGAPVLRAAVG